MRDERVVLFVWPSLVYCRKEHVGEYLLTGLYNDFSIYTNVSVDCFGHPYELLQALQHGDKLPRGVIKVR